jgi:hypothetical protein
MADADWLFEAGVDTTQAIRDLSTFVQNGTAILDGLEKVTLQVNYGQATDKLRSFVQSANSVLSKIAPVKMDVSVNLAGASAALKAFGAQATAQEGPMEALASRIERINVLTDATTRASDLQAGAFRRVSESARAKNADLSIQARLNEADAATARQSAAAHGSLSRSFDGVGVSAKSGAGGIDFMNKIVGNAIFKVIEYEIVIQSFNAVVQEMKNSLTQASNVQFEMKLQHMYNAALPVNQVLSDAIIIARQWGSDIVDVQQVIGLWSKKVGDLGASVILANQAEMLHRASGISTVEVFQKSVGLAEQLGLKWGQLPGVYDQVAEASLKVAAVMKDMSVDGDKGGTAKITAMKDIFEGLTESAAELASVGFRDTASIIGIVSVNLEAMAQSGNAASKGLATMFGGLERGGPFLAKFRQIVSESGKFKFTEGDTELDKMKRSDEMLQQMQKHLKELYQAEADGTIGVKPASKQELATTLTQITTMRDRIKDIRDSSNFKLAFIANQEIETFQGRMDQARTAVQALSITIGNELLPGATRFAIWLSGSLLPGIEHAVPLILTVGKALLTWGGAFLAIQGMSKVTSVIRDFGLAAEAQAKSRLADVAAEEAAQKAGFTSVAAMKSQMDVLRTLTVAQEQYAVALDNVEKLMASNLGMEGELAIAEGRRAGVVGILSKAQGDMAVTGNAVAAADGKQAIEAGAAATANAGLAKSESDVVIGMRAMAGTAGFVARGIGGMAASAVAAVGPFVALLAIMGEVQSMGNSMDVHKRQEAYLHNAELAGMTTSQRAAAIAANGPGEVMSNNELAYANLMHPGEEKSYMQQQAQILGKTNSHMGIDLNTTNEQLATAQNDLKAFDNHSGPFDPRIQAESVKLKQSINDLAFHQMHDVVEMIREKQSRDSGYVVPAGIQKLLDELKHNQNTQNALNAPAGQPPSELPDPNLPSKAKGGAPPSIASQDSAAATKAQDIYTGQMDAYRGAGEAAQSLIEDQNKLGAAFGWVTGQSDGTKGSLAALTSAYKSELLSISEQIILSQQMKVQVGKELADAQKHLAADQAKKDPASQRAAKAEGLVVDELVKKYEALDGTIAHLVGTYKLKSDEEFVGTQTIKDNREVASAGAALGKVGPAADPTVIATWKDYDTVVAKIGVDISTARGPMEVYTRAATDNALAVRLLASATALQNDGLVHTTEYNKGAASAVQELTKSIAESGNAMKSAQEKAAELQKGLRDIGLSSLNTTLKDIEDATGVNRGSITIIQDLVNGYKQYLDMLDQVKQKEAEYGALITPQQQQEVNATRQLIQLSAQMLPLIEEEKQKRLQIAAIQSSAAYKGVNSAIDTYGSKMLTNLENNVFDISSKAPQWKQVLGSVLHSVTDDWFKGFSKQMTDSLFNINKDPNKELEAYETQYAKVLAAIADQNAKTVESAATNQTNMNTTVNNFGQWVVMMKDSIATLPGVSGSPTNRPNGSATNQNGTAMTPWGVADDGSGSDYDTFANGSSTLTNAQTVQQSQLDNLVQIATNTGITSQAATGTGAAGALASANFGIGLAGSGGPAGAIQSLIAGLGKGAGGNSSSASGLAALFGPGGAAAGIFADAGLGDIVGSAVGGALHNGANDAGIGGAIGGAAIAGGFAMAGAGTLLGSVGTLGLLLTPAGLPLLLGAILGGSLLGGLFGSHTSPASSPDIYNTQGYGQTIANLTGATAGANGQTFTPTAANLKQAGGQGEISYIEETLAQYGSAKAAPTWLQPMFNQLEAMFGQSSSGSGKLNFDHDIAEEYITGAAGAGGTFNYADLGSAAAQFMKAAAANKGPLAPIISVQAYGASGSYLNPYNIPGLNASELAAEMNPANKFSGLNLNNPNYNTPGASGNNPYANSAVNSPFTTSLTTAFKNAVATQPINLQASLVLDGKVISNLVFAAMRDYENRNIPITG